MSGLPSRVEAAFLAACRAELDALKPGNVHVHAPGHRMTAEDFLVSAAAAAPAIAAPGLSVGARILVAVEATRAAVGQNTNLGIVLLTAPLAQAALAGATGEGLRAGVERVLAGLTVDDARLAFRAIALANPGGLGDAPEADVREEPTVTLLEAMRLAEDRDRIAWNYAHGLSDLFELGVPRLLELRARGWPESWAVTGTFLAFLARLPDSHVVRKLGPAVAADVRARARPLEADLLAADEPGTLPPRLLALDGELKAAGVNPGTSADLTVASHMAAGLVRELTKPVAGTAGERVWTGSSSSS